MGIPVCVFSHECTCTCLTVSDPKDSQYAGYPLPRNGELCTARRSKLMAKNTILKTKRYPKVHCLWHELLISENMPSMVSLSG